MLFEYYFLFIFLLINLIVAVLIPTLSTLLVYQQANKEKLSTYECGFEPFEEYMPQFEIRYYLIAILFLLFDLELVFFMPWIITLDYLNFYSVIAMFIFIAFLLLAFYYEWLKGGLEWD